MAKVNKFKCPFCNKIYTDKRVLYNHMEKDHPNTIPSGMSPAQYYFNHKYKKEHGSCIMCKKETKWNEQAGRYERLCSKKCEEAYREMFRKRMKAANKDPDTWMKRPEVQKKMLENRKISGKYKWSDGSKEFVYTGTYEQEFLEFMDIFMHWPSSDIMSPAPQIFPYKIDGVDHFYIPDAYIPSLDLILEIKSSTNAHYRARDINIEKTKDMILEKSEHKYFKIFDKKYDDFFNFILEIIYKK